MVLSYYHNGSIMLGEIDNIDFVRTRKDVLRTVSVFCVAICSRVGDAIGTDIILADQHIASTENTTHTHREIVSVSSNR